jgi:hypothetical protein
LIITTSNYAVLELIEMIQRKDLVVNQEYQRGTGLWGDGPSSYFIDTILEKYPFPKIYLQESLHLKDKKVKKEIVDGQQRINTILRFYNNEFSLRKESKYSGLKFKDLDDSAQEAFLGYSVSVDVIRSATRAEVLQMFRRMNAYTLPLNSAEKRHSTYQGQFKWFVNNIADDFGDFFVQFQVFTGRQMVRMQDSELIADLCVAIERGIVSQSPSDLSGVYKKYDESFPAQKEYNEIIFDTLNFVRSHFGFLKGTYLMKPYALHSLLTALMIAKHGAPNVPGVSPLGSYVRDFQLTERALLALAQAHETKDSDGPFAKYVWGSEVSTTKGPRRYARVMSILRSLGVQVSDPDYVSLFA